MQINQKHIEIIDWDLKKRGIIDTPLREDMVDHICVLLEKDLDGSQDFKSAYLGVIKKFDPLKNLQAQTQKEIERVSLSFKFFKMADYFFTFFYVILGAFCLTLPIAVLFYHPITIFFILSPLLIFGYIICFTRINYKKFELIQFE